MKRQNVNSKLDIKKIQKWLRNFAKERDWEQYHTPKNLVMAIGGEVGELTELFQWLTDVEADQVKRKTSDLQKVADEVADVAAYLIRFSDVMGIDLEKAIWAKLHKNVEKYPVLLAKGNAKKYTEFKRRQK